MAVTTQIMLWVVAATAAGTTVALISESIAFGEFARVRHLENTFTIDAYFDFVSAQDRRVLFAGSFILAAIATAVLFIVWMNQAYKATGQFNATDRKMVVWLGRRRLVHSIRERDDPKDGDQ